MNKDYVGNVNIYSYIGGGGYSDVYECDYREEYFAYKKINNETYKKIIEKNIIDLTELYGDNDFLFPYKAIYNKSKDISFDGYVLDYLYKFSELQNIDELDKIKIILRCRDLMEKLHSKYNRLHTDICPWNFLYNVERDSLKLIDFDTSINLSKKEVGDLNYYNEYAASYIEARGIDKDLDIFLFNLFTYALLNNIDYRFVLDRIHTDDNLKLSSEKATSILKSYKDLNSRTLKKEYIIDYIK